MLHLHIVGFLYVSLLFVDVVYRGWVKYLEYLYNLFAGLAEASLALLVVADGTAELLLAEIGPEGVAEVEFGVGRLPEQVIAEAQFAAGTYQQVGVGHEGGGQVLGNQLVADCFGLQKALGHLLGYLPGGFCQFPTRRIAQSQHQAHAAVGCGVCDALVEALLHFNRQLVDVTDDAEADVVLHESLLFDGVEQEGHEGGYLVGGTIPVLGREGVKGQVADAEACSFFGDDVYGFGASLVAEAALLALLFGPASVAIHDDGYMLRDAVGVYLVSVAHAEGI